MFKILIPKSLLALKIFDISAGKLDSILRHFKHQILDFDSKPSKVHDIP